jgi:signal transduction histidine kinase
LALAAPPPRPVMGEANLAAIIREVVSELELAAREDGVEVVVVPAATENELVRGDAVQLAVAVREIYINACEALRRSGRGGRVELSLVAESQRVLIVIRDDGPGLDARARRHLFDPFFSGYESGRGLGFGLTKCWQIVEAHGGEILVDSEAGKGTVFTLRLPRSLD